MSNLRGSSYVATYLGTAIATVHKWAHKEGNGFPEPSVIILADTGSISARGWEEAQLSVMRTWYAKHCKLDEDAANARWANQDRILAAAKPGMKIKKTAPANIHPRQEAIDINIPAQRTKEAA